MHYINTKRRAKAGKPYFPHYGRSSLLIPTAMKYGTSPFEVPTLYRVTRANGSGEMRRS
jgi:hypothetical protein